MHKYQEVEDSESLREDAQRLEDFADQEQVRDS